MLIIYLVIMFPKECVSNLYVSIKEFRQAWFNSISDLRVLDFSMNMLRLFIDWFASHHFSCIEMLWWKYVVKYWWLTLCIVNMHINGNNLNELENNGC